MIARVIRQTETEKRRALRLAQPPPYGTREKSRKKNTERNGPVSRGEQRHRRHQISQTAFKGNCLPIYIGSVVSIQIR